MICQSIEQYRWLYASDMVINMHLHPGINPCINRRSDAIHLSVWVLPPIDPVKCPNAHLIMLVGW